MKHGAVQANSIGELIYQGNRGQETCIGHNSFSSLLIAYVRSRSQVYGAYVCVLQTLNEGKYGGVALSDTTWRVVFLRRILDGSTLSGRLCIS